MSHSFIQTVVDFRGASNSLMLSPDASEPTFYDISIYATANETYFRFRVDEMLYNVRACTV